MQGFSIRFFQWSGVEERLREVSIWNCRKAWRSRAMTGVRNLWAIALLACLSLASVSVAKEQVVHKKTYYSESIELASGDVVDNYKSLDMPHGHIALRDFFAETVDENGNSVPLYELYLHHWVAIKLHVKKGLKDLVSPTPKTITDPNIVTDMHHGHLHRMQFQAGADVKQETRQGTCRDSQDSVFFGVGSETRHTDLSFPAPYGLESGNPAKIPDGYEEAWYLNLHAIDTRGAVDATSCLECLCEAYGETKDTRSGLPLPKGYKGGMACCRDGAHCAVKEDSASPRRKLFLKYTVTWVDMDETVIPVRGYFLDATDPRTSLNEKPNCQTEYDVPACIKGSGINACIDRHHAIGALPQGGDLIQAVLHQHAGGMGGILYDKDGTVLCQSDPIYGKGTEPGDEAGYVVGMTTCFPEPGSVYIDDWKLIKFDAFYSGEQPRTGVMSLFGLHVADPVPHIKEVTN